MYQNYNDQQLMAYVNDVFMVYDVDRSGDLDCGEVANFFNDVYRGMGYNYAINPMQAQQMMARFDYDMNGRTNRNELFMALKAMYQEQSQTMQQYYQPIPQQQTGRTVVIRHGGKDTVLHFKN